MSGGSFVFTSTALRSMQLDEDLLESDRHRKRLASRTPLSGYALKKEARDRVSALRSGHGAGALPPAICYDLVVQNALYTGDAQAVRRLFPKGSTASLVIEPQGGDMRWVARGEGLWSLSYEQELTTPLHITAGRGFADCLRLLLQRGANVELAPGGTTALHESCETCHPECTKLLLCHGANANALSEEGQTALHMCTSAESLECAKHLLQYGAAITARSLGEDDTPLHTAAENGLPEHVELYLRYGAAVDRRNDQGLTPLNAACSEQQEPHELERYFRACALLVEAGSDVRAADQDRQTPLHMACKHANADVVDLLLARGADVNAMNYGCKTPMQMILQSVCYKASQRPERVVRSLLNHGSVLVWHVALPTVLKHCCMSPRTMEVLLNAYSRLNVTESWVEAVPPEVFKEHQEFYESLFSLAQTPRCLQHLARVRLRTLLEGRVLQAVPNLDLPTFLKNYLLLDFRGYVH